MLNHWHAANVHIRSVSCLQHLMTSPTAAGCHISWNLMTRLPASIAMTQEICPKNQETDIDQQQATSNTSKTSETCGGWFIC